MRNQITGGLTLDATALAETIADAVATRLAGLSTPPQQLTPPLTLLDHDEAANILDTALTNSFGVAVDPEGLRRVIAELDAHGYVLAKHTPQDVPYPAVDGRPDDWFGPTP